MKLRLLTKMLLFILIPALIGLMVVASASYLTSRNVLRQQLGQDLSELAHLQARELETATTLLFGILRYTARTPQVVDYLRELAAGGAEAEQRRAAAGRYLREMDQTYTTINGIAIVSPEGRVLIHSEAESGEMNVAERGYFKQAMRSGEMSVEDVSNKIDGRLATIIAQPVRDGGRILGLIFLKLDSASLSGLTINHLAIGEKGRAYVYDRAGMLVLHPDAGRIGKDESRLRHVRAMLEQEEGSVSYAREGGDVHEVYFRHLPVMDWWVCVEVSTAEVYAPIRRLLVICAVLAACCGLAVGLMIYVNMRGVAHGLAGASRVVGHVAAGNLQLSPEEDERLARNERRGDELSLLSRGIRQMIEGLRRLLQESEEKTRAAEQATEEAHAARAEAEEAAHRAESARREGMLAAAGQLESIVCAISAAASQLAAQIEASTRLATESASRLSESATAMNEMNATVQEVAKNAGDASQMSGETRRKATEGAGIVSTALESIQRLHEVSLMLKTDMAQLNAHAQAIDQIMGVISDIADQTNLLALNAAIEAARAGDAGRGFAVVADEVRKLAEKTMSSTADVGNAIRAIQESTGKSSAAVDRAVKEVEQASACANASGGALEAIVQDADRTADQVSAIAAASEQQSAASEEVNRSILEVNDMSNQSARTMNEAAQAIADLAQQTQELSRLIENMKRA